MPDAGIVEDEGTCPDPPSRRRSPFSSSLGRLENVSKWRERFRVRRLEGLTDEPRPGAPRVVTHDHVVDVITRTLEGPPPERTQWRTRTMAEVAGLSKATISRIWRTFGLQSHRVDTFKLSADPPFVEKVRAIVGAA
jgi:hypothetical protein